jgi:hypothetical protein
MAAFHRAQQMLVSLRETSRLLHAEARTVAAPSPTERARTRGANDATGQTKTCCTGFGGRSGGHNNARSW